MWFSWALTVEFYVHILFLALSSTDFPDFLRRQNAPIENEKGPCGNNNFLPITIRSCPQYMFSPIENHTTCVPSGI